MNSTQRLLAVHCGQVPDRVPISTYELVGFNAGAWENREPSYARLMQFIRERTDCLYMTGIAVPNALAGQRDVVIERYDDGDQHVRRETYHIAGRTLTRITSHAENVKTTWTREHPVKDLDDLRAYLALPWSPGEPDFAALNKAWADLGQTRGLPLVSFGDPICELAEAFEFGNFMVHAITETAAISAALDELHERRVESLRRMLAGPVRNVVFRICGPEYATPPYLPPDLFRLFVTKYNVEYCRMIRQAGGFARIHSHGKIARVIDQIVEMAPDAIDPCEPPPDGDIDIAGLKSALGSGVCLTGGIELKHLEHADGAQIETIVRQTMAMGKPGGQFIIMPTAAPIDIPLTGRAESNYMRFIDTALECAKY